MAGPCMLPSYSLCLLSWPGGKSRGERRGEKGREGWDRAGRGGFAAPPTLPQEPLFSPIKFLPLLSPVGWRCLALGSRLVYTARYARFAVAIATTRGQFIEGEEVHFWGVSFPAPVQSTAENKRPRHPWRKHIEKLPMSRSIIQRVKLHWARLSC